ncbi:hypothetical protein IWZ01DRAFT_203383 [Phyllosticta capitalensis]
MALSSNKPVCSIEDRREEISTEHNATCERINLSRDEQRKLLEEQLARLPGPNDDEHRKLLEQQLAEPSGPDDQWQPFPEWLQDDSQLVYWVAGQPSSGKSTLMRFLHDDKAIQNSVRMWADGSRLVKVAFFLRKPTSYEQLLKELLDRAMDGRNLFPRLLLSGNQRLSQPPREVLESGFGEMVSGGHEKVPGEQGQGSEENGEVPKDWGKFLLMIDGVEHLGPDAQALSKLLEQCKSAGQSVKVCISGSYGCPLGQEFQPSVRMEILTKVDIWHNISNELDNSRRFYQLRNDRPERSHEIIRRIVDVADGSFLHARLATAWYFGELAQRENISDLHKQIPSTSDLIFQDLLNRKNSGDRPGPSTARLFGLIQQAERTEKPLSLIVLSFVEELNNHQVLPGIQPATRSEIDERADRMNRYLFYRSGGLLYAPDFADKGALAEVRYHETAKEWKQQLWEHVNENLGFEQKARTLCTELCLAYFQCIKTLDPKQPTFFTSFRSLATACLEYSFKIEQTPGGTGHENNINEKIILALDKDAEKLLNEHQPCHDGSSKTSHDNEVRPWSVKVQGHSNSYSTIGPHWTNVCNIDNYQPPSSLFDFALQHNLFSVVKHHLNKFKEQPTGNGTINGNGNAGHVAEGPQQNDPKEKTWKQKKIEKREKEKAAAKERKQRKKKGENPDLEEQVTDPVCKLVGGRILPLTLIARSQHSKGNPAPISEKMAKILLEYGADPDYEESSEAPGGNTAWHALLKAMASEMPKPKAPPKKTSTTHSRPSTADTTQAASTTQNENRSLIEEERHAKVKRLQAKVKELQAKRSKLLADRDRRYRLTELAVMFLDSGADSYATVRAMPPPPEPSKNEEAGEKSTQEPERFFKYLAKKVEARVTKDVKAFGTAIRNVPKQVGHVHTLIKETWALTRDVNPAKLTLDQIVEAVKKVDGDAEKELETVEIDLEAAKNTLVEMQAEVPTTKDIGHMEKAQWQKVDDAIKKCRGVEQAGSWDVWHERAWAQVKLFAR